MLKDNFFLEIKLLLRSKWILVLCMSLIAILCFATFNGTKNVSKRQLDIEKVQVDQFQKDSIMLATLVKIESGEKVDLPSWRLPSEPMTIADRYPRLAVMNPGSLSFIATGQSDMYTHFKSPSVYGNNFALDFAELVNPVQLLFGNFDLSFVIIYIFPLLIIAFSFNLVSKEKDLGTLRLISAQPISVLNWLLQKAAIRYLIFTVLSLIILLGVLAVFAPSSLEKPLDLFGVFLVISVYNLFWFVMAVIVSVKVNDSSKNALTLIGLWLLLVLVLPATINQVGSSLYPVPSRLKMINEIRLIKRENEENQNKIMSEYLRAHPELAAAEEGQNFGFWQNYFASEQAMQEKIAPLIQEYEVQLQKQQDLIGLFKFLSPAIVMQQSLNTISETSEKHYNDFKKQVSEFSEVWRDYFVPMLFNEEKFKSEYFRELPEFKYQNRIESDLISNIFILLSVTVLLYVVFMWPFLKKRSLNSLLVG